MTSFFKANFKILVLLGFFFIALQNPAQAGVCTLYKGESQLESLQKDKNQFLQKIKNTPDDVPSYCQLSHIHYKIAGQVPENLQETEYNQCIHYADEAIRHNPKTGTAFFMKGLCLGKRGELNGIWSSLQMLDDFETNMKQAVKLHPELDGGGPDRALGRYYFKLPGLLGGSLEKTIHHLEKAMTYGPKNYENLLFLGEAYLEDDRFRPARSLFVRFMEITGPRAQEPKMKKHRIQVKKFMKIIQEEIGSP